eukprot:jgi/Mesen1/8159/ME000438S07268
MMSDSEEEDFETPVVEPAPVRRRLGRLNKVGVRRGEEERKELNHKARDRVGCGGEDVLNTRIDTPHNREEPHDLSEPATPDKAFEEEPVESEVETQFGSAYKSKVKLQKLSNDAREESKDQKKHKKMEKEGARTNRYTHLQELNRRGWEGEGEEMEEIDEAEMEDEEAAMEEEIREAREQMEEEKGEGEGERKSEGLSMDEEVAETFPSKVVGDGDDGELNEKKTKGHKKGDKMGAKERRAEERQRQAEKEDLFATSQRLLRATKGAAFKPLPVPAAAAGQRPIASVLDKIRKRKQELRLARGFLERVQVKAKVPLAVEDLDKATLGGMMDDPADAGDDGNDIIIEERAWRPAEGPDKKRGGDTCAEEQRREATGGAVPEGARMTKPLEDTQDLLDESPPPSLLESLLAKTAPLLSATSAEQGGAGGGGRVAGPRGQIESHQVALHLDNTQTQESNGDRCVFVSLSIFPSLSPLLQLLLLVSSDIF